ncbi:hypothetical protein 035JT004_282 [Bacillus phage 035JT004]|nr:hypothetical protein 035JT004_12 [Bacillus phage 035JT004]QZA69770.1 hypothetical protein 035JT004_282 [Bacillus phage 035JT004]
MLKNIMLETEMEEHLAKNGYNIYDEESCIDSVAVADIACDELGYDSYMMEGSGSLNQTLIFIKS